MKKIFIFLISLFTLFFLITCEEDDGSIIGKTGQGGGMIFFDEGGQYLECSGELGDSTQSAARIAARNYKGGGYEDWRLPTKAELDLIYKNLKKKRLGGFSNGCYWASEEDWLQNFQNGKQETFHHILHNENNGVRAVRSYTDIPPVEQKTTTLTIKNESFIEITDIIWNGVTLASDTNTVKTGNNITKDVTPGSAYIYFKKKDNPIAARTCALISIIEDENKEFVFENETEITEVSNPANTATVQTFYTKPWIIVKQNTNTIDLYSDFSYGSILYGTQKDISFTIENIGAENLTIISANERRINLNENREGHFSILQQPLAAVIAPAGTTSFTIRFEPVTIGNNFSASVHINTNSKNAEEFAFRVNGNSRDYIIGDTGPGGGMIFFAQGGLYMECSDELGVNTWDNAVQIANEFSGGGFDNWNLPTRDQLALMYEKLHLNNLGEFLGVSYWSSEEYVYNESSIEAWTYYFGYPAASRQSRTSKTSSCRIRAVRSFNIE